MTSNYTSVNGMAEKRKHLPEDVVEYFLFPSIPENLHKGDVSTFLEETLDSYLAFVSPLVVDHIWQNEPFSLVTSVEGDLPPHLFGRTSFGDNVDDEWFIVFLLFQLTKRFTNLVARVIDNDEEFMLIEAADVLPKWINPETAENRVYIYNGNLHLIPMPQTPAEITTLPSSLPAVGDSVKCVREYSKTTLAIPSIQNAVFSRINEFPAKNDENVHFAHCYIPANLATVLKKKPSLLAHGVQAFYYRDPIDLRCCRTMHYFQPGTRVVSQVKFTRCLYAQLMQQRFQPDKRSGWVLPAPSNPKFKSHDLGMKLAHGFEILCSKSSKHVSQSNGTSQISDNDLRWTRYLRGLKDRGYFRGELEGSKLYKELLENAKEFYTEQIHRDISQDKYSSVGSEILTLTKTVQYDIEAMRRAEDSLPPPDSDDWLTLTPETLDDILKKKAGTMGDAQDAYDLSKVADSMKTFVDKVSGIEGAEFPGEADEDDDENDVQFDSTGFISAMQKMFDFEDEDSASSSDMSEYDWDDSDADVDDQPPKSAAKKTRRKHKPPSVLDYMQQMDKELSKTKVGESFEKTNKETKPQKKPTPSCDIDDEDDDFKPVDIDLNIVKNMLDSIGAQQGLAGPASNILGPMGVNLPPPEEENTFSPSGQQNSSDSPVPPPRTKKGSTPSSSKSTPARPDKPPRPKAPPRPKEPPRSLRTNAAVQKETTI